MQCTRTEALDQYKAAMKHLNKGQPRGVTPTETSAELTHLIGLDPVVDWMKGRQIPLTLENYLHLAYPDLDDPTLDDLSAEQQADLPEELLPWNSDGEMKPKDTTTPAIL